MSIWFFLWLLLHEVCVRGHVDRQHEHEDAVRLRETWGVGDIVRDMEHIKEDLSTMINLEKTGDITKNEMLFYLIRMHDFDDNGGLDGQELRVIVNHSIEHSSIVKNSPEDIEAMIDEMLQADDSGDGILDYQELRSHM